MTLCLRADLVFPGEGDAIRDGAVVVGERGEILDVGPASDVLPRSRGARIDARKGLLLPGLVNAHTHVELSHLRGKVPGGAGFFPWVLGLLSSRANASDEEVHEGVEEAVAELHRAGTVAVGDVSNGLGAVHALARAKIGGSVFHEVFGYDRARSMDRLLSLAKERADVVGAWPTNDLRYAPAPHTLYTIHPDIVRAAHRAARELGERTSIHLAEHPAEREFLERGTGPVVSFAATVGADLSPFPVPKRSPIAYADELGLLDGSVLLVHMTTATRAEIDLVAKRGAPVVLCPRSNLHIEVRVPPAQQIVDAGIVPALGTDSLASCPTLDVLAEAKAIAERFPSIPSHVVLRMATAAGADALGRGDLGRFAKGKRPGIVAIEGDVSAHPDPLRFFLSRPPSARTWAMQREVA